MIVITPKAATKPLVDRFGRRYIEIQKPNGGIEWKAPPMTTEDAEVIRETGLNAAHRQIVIIQAIQSTSDKARTAELAPILKAWQRYIADMAAVNPQHPASIVWPEQPEDVT
ncbi:tail fiber assembly protein [Brenneria corticis]|uniref:Tail assembly chaperone n=1 Tax=Brenneria corticis TaxID=2173106 RepID=A0A2U1TU70_9GAMM|nr:tail fiber assembly protein [Brenneria sp. CFCC 11842]PWC12956.1 tail assembly chaperone [Brenneria sp. CFCC 11842]